MSDGPDDLFRRARMAGHPTPDDLARAKRGIDAKLVALGIASAAGVASKGAAAAGSVAPKAVGVSLAVKLLSVLGVVAAVTAVGVSLTVPLRAGDAVSRGPSSGEARRTPPPLLPADGMRVVSSASGEAVASAVSQPATRAVTPAVPEGKDRDRRLDSVPPPPAIARVSPPERAIRDDATAVPLPAPSSSVAGVLGPPVPQPPPQPPTARSSDGPPVKAKNRLAEEIPLLRRIDDAIRAGDGTTALVGIEEHSRTFSDGALVEEREAARVLALCALGHRDAAENAAAAFRARFPRSTSAARLGASCVGSTP